MARHCRAQRRSSETVETIMQNLAREMMLEYLGYEVPKRDSVEIDAVELCAALGWACAIVVEVACGGTATLQQLANEKNSRGVALVCALCDQGEDTLEAAGTCVVAPALTWLPAGDPGLGDDPAAPATISVGTGCSCARNA